MAQALFPSGPWVGFYTYSSLARRYLMDLHLLFRGGRIEGEGADGIDFFSISGVYDEQKAECAWQKLYPTRPAVAYSGYREGKGIWGTWSLPSYTGGFHIWPLTEGGPPDLRELEAEDESEELVTMPAAPIRL
jgi:hypothetical protein